MNRTILHLTKKSVKTLLRQPSVALLIAVSTIVVYGSLMITWWLSRGNFRTILSSVSQMLLDIRPQSIYVYHFLNIVACLCVDESRNDLFRREVIEVIPRSA